MLRQPIFIGGTGRSGTTILKKILGRHPELYTTPQELKLIIEPDGLVTLADNLSTRWSPARSAKAIERFQRLARNLRDTPWHFRTINRLGQWLRIDVWNIIAPVEYSRYRLGQHLGLAHFEHTLSAFIDFVTLYEFRGRIPSTSSYRILPSVKPGRRFDRAEIMKVCNQLLYDLFEPAMRRSGRTRFVEDSPGNLVHAPVLREMFPDLKFIHIYRDPRDVIASSRRQVWSPAELESAVRRIRQMTAAWMSQREQLPPDQVLELRFEDLVESPEPTLRCVTDFIGVRFDDGMLDVDLSRHNIGRHRRDCSDGEIAEIERHLSEWLTHSGYRA